MLAADGGVDPGLCRRRLSVDRRARRLQPDQTSKLYAADGRFIAELGLERRTLVPLDEMSPAVLKHAFLVTEDKRFYEHRGIDWLRVPGAVVER